MPEIGELLGDRYRLLELLGEGGMATIFRGRDLKLERDVAVKLLRPEYGRDAAFVARFRQEAQAAASLAHPNVVAVFDYGTEAAGPYIVMELVEGQDLGRILRDRGALSAAASARIAMQIADGLAAAHAQGIVHRDIKPSNVLITVSGQVKVADFGIARALSEAQLTLPGQTLGSARYLSPEQARGENVTPAADIYSLGLVLFEMLTGRAAWGGDTAAAVAMVRLTEEPPVPSSHRADVPPAMDAIVRKALQRDPTQRFGSAGAFSDALGRFLSGLHAGVAAPVVSAPASVRADQSPTVVGVAAPPSLGVGSGRPPQRPHDAAADEANGGRGPGAWAWAAALLGVAVLVAAGALIYLFLNAGGGGGATPKPSGKLVEVPAVVDLSVLDARATLEGAGLVMVITDSVVDETRPSNTVVAQVPAAGESAPAGSDVKVTIATGRGTVPVPDVRRRTEEEAITIFVERKLTPGTKSEAFDPIVPAGQVISTSPQTGVLVAEGTPIDYVISTGPEPTLSPSPTPIPTPTPVPTPIVTPAPFPVYDYRCVQLAAAEAALQADGFTVGTITGPSGFDTTWPVGGQNPAPGATAVPGTPIDLTVYDPASLATCPP